jgi:hypothetical protein
MLSLVGPFIRQYLTHLQLRVDLGQILADGGDGAGLARPQEDECAIAKEQVLLHTHDAADAGDEAAGYQRSTASPPLVVSWAAYTSPRAVVNANQWPAPVTNSGRTAVTSLSPSTEYVMTTMAKWWATHSRSILLTATMFPAHSGLRWARGPAATQRKSTTGRRGRGRRDWTPESPPRLRSPWPYTR